MDAERVEWFYGTFSSLHDLVYGPLFHQSRRYAVNVLDAGEGERVLDVGVGTGLNLPHFPKSCQIVGIDFCAPMLARAKNRLARRQMTNVSLLRMDAMRMTFADNTFDSVFAGMLITTVSDPDQVISEIIRVCKPGGKIVMFNHFQNRNRFISAFEKVFSPVGKRLGFCPDLELGGILEGKPLMVTEKKSVKPLNLWKVVTCINKKDIASNGHGNGNGNGNGHGRIQP
ncbi:MAG: class I SAM-dependent methyltransferase [Nitrospiria bacterium]